MARFDKTFCSNCGREFGPGDHGFSHCDQHPGYQRDRKLARQAAAKKGWRIRKLMAAARLNMVHQAVPSVAALQAAE